MKHETTGWQWHQVDHVQIICTSLQTDNNASTSPQAACCFWCPASSVKALKAFYSPTRDVGECPTWWPPCRI